MSSSWPVGSIRWTDAEIRSDVARAAADFRARRIAEPLSRYLGAFDAVHPGHLSVVAKLRQVLRGDEESLLRELWSGEAGRTAFRYLGAPPVSLDDLETLAETKLGAAAAEVPARRARLLEVVRAMLDPRRFPWVTQDREPTEEERHAAALALSALVASQRVQTLRRGDERSMVEGATAGVLTGMGWRRAAQQSSRGIQNLLSDSPAERTFVTQCTLGGDNADLVVRLDDGRLLAIECKGSNSSINSRKRLNKEAAQNARAWLDRFGSQVVPAVALQGVFNERYVTEAQATPMLIFWSHRLEDIRRFVEQAR